jgi:hypothetical protein
MEYNTSVNSTICCGVLQIRLKPSGRGTTLILPRQGANFASRHHPSRLPARPPWNPATSPFRLSGVCTRYQIPILASNTKDRRDEFGYAFEAENRQLLEGDYAAAACPKRTSIFHAATIPIPAIASHSTFLDSHNCTKLLEGWRRAGWTT